MGTLTVNFGPRIGQVELNELDVAAWGDGCFALAALLQAKQQLVFDLQVPSVVVLARLQNSTRRRHGIPAAFHLDGVKVRPIGFVVARVDHAAQHVTRLEVQEFVGACAHGLEVSGCITRGGPFESAKHMFGNDHACGTAKRVRPKWRSLRVLDTDRVAVDLGDLDVFVGASGVSGCGRIQSVFVGEHHIVGCEGPAVVPLHISLQLPGDGFTVPGHATIGRRWHFSGQNRDHVAIAVPSAQGLIKDARTFLVLGAAGKVRLQQGGALPPEQFQGTATTAFGGLVGRSRLGLSQARGQKHLSGHGHGQAIPNHVANEVLSADGVFPNLFNQSAHCFFVHGRLLI